MTHGCTIQYGDARNITRPSAMAALPGFEPGLLVPKANRISSTPQGRMTLHANGR